MPISYSPTTSSSVFDIISEQIWVSCNECGCVQLKYLIDPNVLYNSTHNLTYTFPLWNQHHTSFSDFILNNIQHNNLMEIGGSSGALYNKLKGSNINYSCIDLCEASFDTSNIKYEIANCENYMFINNNCIAASHIFEHLYEPTKFIKNISKQNIDSVFISIPNMEILLEKNNPLILNYEHTYYIDTYFIQYLFSKEGYSLIKSEIFKEHSLFFYFKKTNCNEIKLEYRISIKDTFIKINEKINNTIKNIDIKENSFIVPGGYLGQIIYTINRPKSILGFLDNDISKQNKRLYGTPYYMYSFDKLKEYNQLINLYVFAGPYINEICNQLKNYNNILINII
jgi:hypothetical protein